MKKIKLFDILSIIFVLALAIVSAVPAMARDDGDSLEIAAGGDVRSVLMADGTHVIESGGYSLTIVISDGAAKVAHSNCPDGLCMAMPAISHAGESIVCVPAEVVIRVSGRSEGGIDGIAG